MRIYIKKRKKERESVIGQCRLKKPIALRERENARYSELPDKKHQTKPPAFTESAGPAAPSLERVHVASFLQHRPHFFRWHRSRRCAVHREKDRPGKGKFSGITCIPVVIDTLRMHCPFTDRRLFFCGNRDARE